MYHAHAHGDIAVPNGLLGAFIVGDVPVPLGQNIGGLQIPDQVDITQRIPMVVNDAGVIGLTLNGKGFPAKNNGDLRRGGRGIVFPVLVRQLTFGRR
jgi:hypothetical protein